MIMLDAERLHAALTANRHLKEVLAGISKILAGIQTGISQFHLTQLFLTYAACSKLILVRF